jgi:hypothetical protein
MKNEIKLTVDLDGDDPRYALLTSNQIGWWTLTVGSFNEQSWFSEIPQTIRNLVREVQRDPDNGIRRVNP